MSEVRLSDGRALVDVSEVVGEIDADFRVGQAGQLTIPVADAAKVLRAGVLDKGTRLTLDGDLFDVSVASRSYGAQVGAELLARSALVRALRKAAGVKAADKVTPQTWIGAAAKAAGGVAVVQPGAQRRRVVQKRGMSALGVIAALAGEMNAEWVEHSNTIFVGTGWWALQGGTGLPTWPAEIGGEAVHGFEVRESDDDAKAEATAEATLAREFGTRLRPWHRLQVRGAQFAADNGLWLVDAVNWAGNPAGAVNVSLTRPVKTALAKKGSSSGGAESGAEVLPGSPVAGSSFSDAARPSGWRGRSVASILSLYQANRTRGLGNGIYNSCLFTSQEVAGYPHVGASPNALIPALGSRLIASRSVVPGAVMLYRGGTYGHAIVYLGGGRALSTDADESGNYRAGVWSVCPADKIASSFGQAYVGWYAP